ncbi:MAG: hypothetical protein AB1394_07470 [Bacteroidota bacterium]
MARKKKTIVHFKKRSNRNRTFCGITKLVHSTFSLEKDERMTIKELVKLLTDPDERLCHKCKHIHKLNLAKVK